LKKFSKKLNVQLLAEILKAFGIEHIVLSPGSRNGALSTHFTHHPDFKTYSIVDERSAGFVALGMAQQLQKPVVVCCTSGSALVNYYPAVTEAFFQNVPLIVLSADRPIHLVDNFDGQTIRQKNALELHTYHSTQLDEDDATETLTDNLGLIKKAVTISIQKSGPVHINMPFSEPLYEFQETLDIEFDEFKIPQKEKEEVQMEEFINKWNNSSKKLVLVGMQQPHEKLNQLMKELSEDESVVILTETTSNLHHSKFFNKIDSVIFSLSEVELEELKPEILITIGQNVVSKKVKSFIRNHPPSQHWHLDEFWQPDTFQCLTDSIKFNLIEFLENFIPSLEKKENSYYEIWNSIRIEKQKKQEEFSSQIAFSDFKAIEKIVETYPKNAQIQYGNSSIIRYAQLFDHEASLEVFCNRGTSGIDGCTSTAAGAALVNEKQTILVSGDISFFYDSNGLWNPYLPSNFRIILINNGGGNIFKIIPGPDQSGVVDSVFETRHHLTAEHLAKMFDFEYVSIQSLEELNHTLENFYSDSNRPKIMEVQTSAIENAEIMRAYFKV
jgi:2-succinyl-5-enolpyruvyl-6-hydroxy-3-cyclohexene-1-carboxylate synthase